MINKFGYKRALLKSKFIQYSFDCHETRHHYGRKRHSRKQREPQQLELGNYAASIVFTKVPGTHHVYIRKPQTTTQKTIQKGESESNRLNENNCRICIYNNLS